MENEILKKHVKAQRKEEKYTELEEECGTKREQETKGAGERYE